MNAKKIDHTPGPWEAIKMGYDWKVRSVDYGTIVNRICYPDHKVDYCVEGDAKLIAAAPELLATLKYVVENEKLKLKCKKMIEKVIIKAETGE